MNQPALYSGPLGTRGLPWNTTADNGRYVVLRTKSGAGDFPGLLITGLDANKTYALRTVSDQENQITVDALPARSRLPDTNGKTVTLDVGLGDFTIGTVVQTGSIYIEPTTLTPPNPSNRKVRDRFGVDAAMVLHLVEITEGAGTPILNGLTPVTAPGG